MKRQNSIIQSTVLIAGIALSIGSAQAVSTFSVSVDCRGPQGVDEDSSTQVPTKLCHSGTLEATATAVSIDNLPRIGAAASAESLGGNGSGQGRATASFTDQITVVNNRLPFNTTVFMDLDVFFHGSVRAVESLGTLSDGAADPFGQDLASATGSLSFSLGGVVNDRIDLNQIGGPTVDGDSIDQMFDYDNLAVRVGQTYNFGMDAFATAFARYSDPAALGPARATADFDNTLAWAGIAAIRDANGNLLDLSDFIFEGASGFDYKNSAVADVSAVPLPATAWLFVSGCLGLIGATRRKKKIARR